MFRLLLLMVVFVSSTSLVHAKVVAELSQYEVDGIKMQAYLAYDDAIKTDRPGILVVHEWWGHNDYARKRARMLAEMGYTALALDMYGDGKQAKHPADAKAFSSAVKKNLPLARRRFEAAKQVLISHNSVDKRRISAIGYCFGGGIVLEMMRMGVDLDAVVSFHGSLDSSLEVSEKSKNTRVLVLNGAADPFVKPEQINSFHQQMKAAGVDYRLISYPGAKHAFTNPDADVFAKKFGMPLAYQKAADVSSWKEMSDFLCREYQQHVKMCTKSQ